MAVASTSPTVPRYVNVIMKALLRSPLLHRLVSGNTMLLTVTGRKSGTIYTFPVSYQRDGTTITCYTDHGWWRNLSDGAPVTMVVAGRRLTGTGRVVSLDHDANVESLRAFLLRTPRDAKYHNVRTDGDGGFNPQDLDHAARTSVMVQIRTSER